MLYRRSAQLAVEAVLLLASEPEGTCRRVRELARDLDVPASYLAKIVQGLTRVGVLRAVRGPGGGVQLAHSPRETRLWDVLVAIEPAAEFERCFLKPGQCSETEPCALHEEWAPIREQVLGLLQTKTLWEIATRPQRRGGLRRQPASTGTSRLPSSLAGKQA